jgi:SAM-dependent methyltransferase
MGRLATHLKTWLAEPLTRGLDLDDPRTTELRREILRRKTFLRKIYAEWYAAIAAAVPAGDAPVLELGSGAGFLKDHIPEAITSDVFPCPGVDRVVDAQQLEFATGSLRAIVMIDVLHHLPQVRRFFAEAARCVRPGGVVVMIEPWLTAWSKLVYARLHHEPFDTAARQWEFPLSGPLSGANGALPWIVFRRDRAQFEREFPEWRIQSVAPRMPMRYLLSGGMSVRSLVPGWTFGVWRWAEGALGPLMDYLAMFALIVLARTDAAPAHRKSPEETTCQPR